MVSVCDPLNIFVGGGRSFSNMVSVYDPSPMFSLLKESSLACTISTKRATCEFARHKKLFNIIVVSEWDSSIWP